MRQASLHDVEVKIEFATDLLHALDVEFDELRDSGRYRCSAEICRGGLHHVYRAIDPPPGGRYWGAQIGAVAHALRSSLEHLAWQLVIANGGSPSSPTHFPVYRRKPGDDETLEISGDIPSGALKIIEAAQPYNGTSDGKKLLAIHDLDVFDKHRQLMITVAVVHMASTHGPTPLPQSQITFTRQPLGRKNVAAVVKYEEPQTEPDSNLNLIPYMVFGKGAPHEAEIVSAFMWQLLAFVEFEILPRFHEWVPPPRRPVSLPTRPRHPRYERLIAKVISLDSALPDSTRVAFWCWTEAMDIERNECEAPK
jgi:hypothetical protein